MLISFIAAFWRFPASITSFEISAISPICPVIFLIVSAVLFAISEPCSAFSILVAISSDVSFADFWLLAARFLTSSATTAKPFPCSPALAASTAALSARILVWNAISSITLIIFDILFDASFISLIDFNIFPISLLTTLAFSWALLASSFENKIFSVFFSVCLATSAIVAVSSSTALACSVAPCARLRDESAILFEPTATCSEENPISLTRLLRFPIISSSASLITANCPS